MAHSDSTLPARSLEMPALAKGGIGPTPIHINGVHTTCTDAPYSYTYTTTTASNKNFRMNTSMPISLSRTPPPTPSPPLQLSPSPPLMQVRAMWSTHTTSDREGQDSVSPLRRPRSPSVVGGNSLREGGGQLVLSKVYVCQRPNRQHKRTTWDVRSGTRRRSAGWGSGR